MRFTVEPFNIARYALPKLVLNPEVKSIFDFRFEDVAIADYEPYPAIKAPVAV